MMIEGEKAVLCKEPEFSSGEAEELSRDVLLICYYFKGQTTKRDIQRWSIYSSILFRNVGLPRSVIFAKCLPGLLSMERCSPIASHLRKWKTDLNLLRKFCLQRWGYAVPLESLNVLVQTVFMDGSFLDGIGK